MHKQFQKLGLFVTNNLNDEATSKLNEKYVKYLYKKESASADRSSKRKIKSANDSESPKHSRKHKQEEKSKRHRKNSNGSLGIHKKQEPVKHASETEIFFISPEEIKRHRKKLNRSEEKSPDGGKRKHSTHRSFDNTDVGKTKIQHRQDEIEKLFKQHTNKSKERDNYDWLNKKEIFKIINNVQQTPKNSPSTSPSFLKKFFLFDKEDQNKTEFIPVNESKYSRKSYNSGQDDLTFARFKSPTDKKDTLNESQKKKHREQSVDKMKENHKKKHREQSIDTMYVKESKRSHDKNQYHDNQNVKRHHKDGGDAEANNVKKKHSPARESGRVVCDDIQIFQKKKDPPKSPTTKHRDKKIENEEKISVKTKNKPVKKEELKQKLQNVSRVNPKRHKLCLVKDTFSIIEIPPKDMEHDKLEVKKQLKPFKNYYKYDRDDDTEISASSNMYTFSDSHKMYQDTAESLEDTSKRHRHTPNSSLQASKLKFETHTQSSVVMPHDKDKLVKKASRSSEKAGIDESARIAKKCSLSSRCSSRTKRESPKLAQNQSQSGRDGERTIRRRKSLPKKSKIPVPNSSKVVELARDPSPASKSRRRSADLFKSKFSQDGEDEAGNIKSSSRKKRNSAEFKDHEDITNKTSSRNKSSDRTDKNLPASRPSSARSSIGKDRPSSPKSRDVKEIASTKNKIRPTSVTNQQESKMSKASAASKQGKMSGSFDKKLVDSNRNKKVSLTSEPTNYQKVIDKHQKGNKSPTRLSNDGASSVWSKGSKNTNKTSLSSKSDTRLAKRREASSERKCKTYDRSSAKASRSNSTCDDKSMDSARNTTSFFLTKTYKDDDKLNRWQKRKLYSDGVRRNAINKNQKASGVPPQVMEVRYLTVNNSKRAITAPYTNLSLKEKGDDVEEVKQSVETSLEIRLPLEEPDAAVEFYKEDLPEPCFELVEEKKFREFFETSAHQALNEIMKENVDFLQKDFSFKMEDLDVCFSSDDFSSDDLQSDKDENDWYNFKIGEGSSISDISCNRRNSEEAHAQELSLDSRDHILDSLSAPGSEESGYSTLKSRQASRSFFQQPSIKALLQTPVDSYCVHIERSSSSSCGLEIRSIESKSLQTTVECSQKSVQIKLSQEEMFEMIHFRNQSGQVKEETKETASVTNNKVVNQNKDLEREQHRAIVEDDERNCKDRGVEDLHAKIETKKEEMVQERLTLEGEEGSSPSHFIRDRLDNTGSFTDNNSEEGSEIYIFVTENKTQEGMYDICEIVTRDQIEETLKERRTKKPASRYKKFKRKVSSWSCLRCYSSEE